MAFFVSSCTSAYLIDAVVANGLRVQFHASMCTRRTNLDARQMPACRFGTRMVNQHSLHGKISEYLCSSVASMAGPQGSEKEDRKSTLAASLVRNKRRLLSVSCSARILQGVALTAPRLGFHDSCLCNRIMDVMDDLEKPWLIKLKPVAGNAAPVTEEKQP